MMANSESTAPAIKLFGKTIIQTDDKHPTVQSASPELATENFGAAKEETIAAEAAAASAQAAAAAARAGLVCPRCKSKETKFCYFNNYNVNQPRHFCKSCHRYWTAGGSQRFVPVGAGRRKNHRLPASEAAAASSSAAEEVS